MLHIKLVAFIIHLQHREMVEETRYFDTYEIVQQPNGNFYPYLARLYTEAFLNDIVSRGHEDCKNRCAHFFGLEHFSKRHFMTSSYGNTGLKVRS